MALAAPWTGSKGSATRSTWSLAHATDIPDAQIDRLVDGFSQKLLHLLIVDQLDIIPVIGEVLTLIGLIDRVDHDGVDTSIAEPAWTERTLRLDRTGRLLPTPLHSSRKEYGWGSMAFDGARLFDELGASLSRLGVPSLLLDDPRAGRQPSRCSCSMSAWMHPRRPRAESSAISPLAGMSSFIARCRYRPGRSNCQGVAAWSREWRSLSTPHCGWSSRRARERRSSWTSLYRDSMKTGFAPRPERSQRPLSQRRRVARKPSVDRNTARELTVTGLLREGRLSIDPAEADGFISSLVARHPTRVRVRARVLVDAERRVTP